MEEEKIEISCIGSAYIQPILDLYSKISKEKFDRKSIIRTSFMENGYSVSVVALTAFCIESFTNKLKYHKKRDTDSTLDFLKKEYPQYKELYENLNELITLRNAIAHNHIWKISYRIDELYNEKDIEKTLLDGYGKGAFNEVVDKKEKVTKKLRLRIIPTRIGVPEAKAAISILHQFSNFLDKEGFKLISNWYFEYDGDNKKLKEIVEIIKREGN